MGLLYRNESFWKVGGLPRQISPIKMQKIDRILKAVIINYRKILF